MRNKNKNWANMESKMREKKRNQEKKKQGRREKGMFLDGAYFMNEIF